MDPFERRRAGVLLHPTSLPGSIGNGEFGADAYRFIDFLADCRISLWQMLPLGPTHSDKSPYQCLSVHAGNTRLISLQRLVDAGWLDDASLDPQQDIDVQRQVRLAAAYNGFLRHADSGARAALEAFKEQHAAWLDDFVLYQVLRDEFSNSAWFDWPEPLRDREPDALNEAHKRLASAIDRARFEQFLFFQQWMQLRHYANERGVLLFGDIPIFVAYDSADVWANRQCFLLDKQGGLKVVAGVPPDYFSETGQRWGNPHYDWEAMADDGYSWWLDRIRTQLELFDVMRIDHFRGFEAYWEIDAAADTAINGRWVAGPGAAFFETLRQTFGGLPLVAEDLGVITPEVTALRRQFGLPGMKILQFAFDGSPDNPYLPHNHELLSVVYTGTHDNNTTLGWYDDLPEETRNFVCDYLGVETASLPGPLLRAALASVAQIAMLPMQDVLGLDASHRMNIPGIAEGNWQWRFVWDQVLPEHGERLKSWVQLYGRA